MTSWDAARLDGLEERIDELFRGEAAHDSWEIIRDARSALRALRADRDRLERETVERELRAAKIAADYVSPLGWHCYNDGIERFDRWARRRFRPLARLSDYIARF